jgi:hypothetical protein
MKGLVEIGADSDPSKSLRYVFGSADDQAEYNEAKIVNEANLLASVHSIRAMYEIFAQLVNTLVLSNRFSVSECTIHKVETALPDSDLKAHMSQLICDPWFLWLSDFVNTIKHRRLMKHTFLVGIEKPTSEIEIEGFEYNGREHNAYTDLEILKGSLEVKNKVVDCGNALNKMILK